MSGVNDSPIFTICHGILTSYSRNRLVKRISRIYNSPRLSTHDSWHDHPSALSFWDSEKFNPKSRAKKHTKNIKNPHGLPSRNPWLREMAKIAMELVNLVGGFSPTHLQNIIVKLDHETPGIGVKITNI